MDPRSRDAPRGVVPHGCNFTFDGEVLLRDDRLIVGILAPGPERNIMVSNQKSTLLIIVLGMAVLAVMCAVPIGSGVMYFMLKVAPSQPEPRPEDSIPEGWKDKGNLPRDNDPPRMPAPPN